MSLPQVQYGAYVNIGGLGSVIKLMFAGILFLLLVKFSFGRKLLTKVSVQNRKELSVWRFFLFSSSLLLVFFCLLPTPCLFCSTRNFSLLDASQRKDQPRNR